MFADFEKRLEEAISHKVLAAVKEEHGSFADAQDQRWKDLERQFFQQIAAEHEEAMSQKIVAAVKEQHAPFADAQEQRWMDLEKQFFQQIAAEHDRFQAAREQAVQELQKLVDSVASASSTADARAREVELTRVQLDDELGKQRNMLSDVHALVEDVRREAADLRGAASAQIVDLAADGVEVASAEATAVAPANASQRGGGGAAARRGAQDSSGQDLEGGQRGEEEEAAAVAPTEARPHDADGSQSPPCQRAPTPLATPLHVASPDPPSDADSDFAFNEAEQPSDEAPMSVIRPWGKQVSEWNLSHLSVGENAPRAESHTLLRKIKMGGVVLLTTLFLGVLIFPYSMVSLLCIGCLWLLYLCGEESVIRLVSKQLQGNVDGRCNRKSVMLVRVLRKMQQWRSSHDNETYIEAILGGLSMCLIVWFNPEFGPLQTVYGWKPYPLMALLFLVVNTYFFYRVVEAMRYRALYGSGQSDSHCGNEAVQKVMEQIRQCLQESGWRKKSNNSMRKIHTILAHSAILNDLMVQMDQNRMLMEVFNHFHGEARSELVEMLCKTRKEDLSVQAKSALLHTLMVIKLSSIDGAESCVESLLLSAYGDELSELKSWQDCRGDINSMHQLLFVLIKDDAIRMNLLTHFLSQGAEQVAQRALNECGHFKELMEEARRRGAHCVPEHLEFYEETLPEDRVGSWLKIITDIDDTLTCSAGKWPAGIDNRYPKKTVYPGVTAFYRELEGGMGSELQGGGGSGGLVALSARPHVIGELMEQSVFNKFKTLMKDNGLHDMPALLTGSMDAGGKFLLTGGDHTGMKALCDKKYDSFCQYLSLYPEFRIVFIGDNGQADYALGQRICREFPHNVVQVWIHQVQDPSLTWKYEEKDSDAKIDYFEDYILAAVSAATLAPHPLISGEGLRRVVVAATDDFQKISNWSSDEQRMSEVNRLNSSIMRACQVMHFLGVEDVDDIDLIDRQSRPEPAGSDGDSDGGAGRSWKAAFWAKGTMAARMLARAPMPVPPKAGCEDSETQTERLDTCQEPAVEADASPSTLSTEAPSALPTASPPAGPASEPSLPAAETRSLDTTALTNLRRYLPSWSTLQQRHTIPEAAEQDAGTEGLRDSAEDQRELQEGSPEAAQGAEGAPDIATPCSAAEPAQSEAFITPHPSVALIADLLAPVDPTDSGKEGDASVATPTTVAPAGPGASEQPPAAGHTEPGTAAEGSAGEFQHGAVVAADGGSGAAEGHSTEAPPVTPELNGDAEDILLLNQTDEEVPRRLARCAEEFQSALELAPQER